jgi:hypothetical protein
MCMLLSLSLRREVWQKLKALKNATCPGLPD